jgi:hypothetical protein
MDREISRVEEKVRDYFSQVQQQIQDALTEDVRESFPYYAQEMDETLHLCRDFIDYAYIDFTNDEKEQFRYLEWFANRIVVLEKLLENPTPGSALAINTEVTEKAFRGLRSTLLQRYEVYFPIDDDLSPPALQSR